MHFLLTLAYDGTNYCGFQVQPNGRSVAAVFQDALEAVLGTRPDIKGCLLYTSEEDVAFALENLGVPPDDMRRRVDESMNMSGIYEFRERAPHNLSGGQKQRVAIADVYKRQTSQSHFVRQLP